MKESLRIVRLPEILERTGLSKSAWYRAISEGKAPKPSPILGSRAVGWSSKSIDNFVESVLEEAA